MLSLILIRRATWFVFLLWQSSPAGFLGTEQQSLKYWNHALHIHNPRHSFIYPPQRSLAKLRGPYHSVRKPEKMPSVWIPLSTVKLVGASLTANAVDFTSGSLVKWPHTQSRWVTCRSPVKTGTLICTKLEAPLAKYTGIVCSCLYIYQKARAFYR